MAIFMTSDWNLGRAEFLKEIEDSSCEKINTMQENSLNACKALREQNILYILGDEHLGIHIVENIADKKKISSFPRLNHKNFSKRK